MYRIDGKKHRSYDNMSIRCLKRFQAVAPPKIKAVLEMAVTA
jgi:hypothetical protein